MQKQDRQAHSNDERNELLSSFDRDNISLVNDILKYIKLLSEIDIANTNKKLTGFVNNLKWDGGFMMRLLSIPFANMDNVSFTIKKQMLSEISDVVMKFKELPAEQKQIETYD